MRAILKILTFAIAFVTFKTFIFNPILAIFFALGVLIIGFTLANIMFPPRKIEHHHHYHYPKKKRRKKYYDDEEDDD